MLSDNRLRQVVRRVVERTDRFPLRALYAGYYRAATAFLGRQLRACPVVRAVYLSGSYALGEHLHGRSDIDFFVVIDGPAQAHTLKPILERCVALFPCLGPLSERFAQIVVMDPEGRIDNAALLYRHRAGLLQPLLVRPGFRLEGRLSAEALWAAERALQVRLALGAVLADRDDLCSWRSRLSGLRRLAALSDRRLALDGFGEALVATPPGRLAGRREQLDRAYQVFRQALEALAWSGPSEVPWFPNLPEGPRPHLDDPDRQALVGREGPLTLRLPGVWVGVADPRSQDVRESGSMHSWLPLSRMGFAESILVIGFEEVAAESGGPGTGPAAAVSWVEQQARSTRAGLAEQFANGERSVFESDWALIQALLAVPLSQGQPGGRPALLDYLERAHPRQGPLLAEVSAYARALETGQGRAGAARLSPNFFGQLIAFTRFLLGLGPEPEPGELQRRLRLSLCVVTRGRPDWLKAMLESVAAQERRPDQVVVVDNCPDGSAAPVAEALARELPLTYVQHPRGRLGNVRNRAIREATGEIICFSDDDCLLDPDWVGHVERSFLRDARIGAVGGRVRHLSGPPGPLDRFHQIYLG